MRRLLILLPLLALAACSSSSSNEDGSLADGEDQEQASATKILESQMRSDPQAQPDGFCDKYTQVTLLKARTGRLILELENRLGGSCEIFVAPDKHSYTVTESSNCGSKIYKGTKDGDTVELQDNRTRLCEDLRPAILELKEKRSGFERALYGAPAASSGGNNGGGGAAQVLDVKLYDQPHAQVSQFCDKHTHLGLKRAAGGALSARLEYKLSATSSCEIFIAPNEKLFTVTQSDDCGTKVYSSPPGPSRVVIKDHSTRLCENVIPARVEVELTEGGQTRHLYTAE
jgi:hypothetical protein